MKTTLKRLILLFAVIIAMLSCEKQPTNKYNSPNQNPTPSDLYELNYNIRPTKPIKVPDTMTIVARPFILKTTVGTVP